jgi:trehalose 6-phosphate phosphatase
VRAALEPIVACAPAIAVVLDFDGSLAPIVDDPAAAHALPEAIEAVRRLVGRVQEIAIVSGRPVGFLRRAVPVPGVLLLGQYGLEREGPGTSTLLDPRAVEALGDADLARIAREAHDALPDVRVEEKGGVAVTLHWREHPDAEAAATAWGHAVAARHGLALAPGRMALELRPRVTIDKGTAVRDLVLGPPGVARDRLQAPRALVVAGDDLGDLPAFDATAALLAAGHLDAALRIGVRSSEAPAELAARCDLVVAGPLGLSQSLGVLARSLGR